MIIQNNMVGARAETGLKMDKNKIRGAAFPERLMVSGCGAEIKAPQTYRRGNNGKSTRSIFRKQII